MLIRVKIPGANKFMTITLLILISLFTIAAIYLAFVNDFAPEIDSLLFKAIGAILVGAYFMVSTFFINSKPETEFRVPVPIMYDRTSGNVFAPYFPLFTPEYRPEQHSVFKGLKTFNEIKLYNKFKGLEIWDKLKIDNQNDIHLTNTYRLEILEYAFFQWLEGEANWLKVNEQIVFGESGSGGSAQIISQRPKNSTQVDLGKILNPNSFYIASSSTVTLPKGAEVTRKTEHSSIIINIRTRAGIIRIMFQPSTGGVFQE